VIFYGIASAISENVDHFHPTRAEAEETLAAILRDDLDLDGDLWVEPVELPEPSRN